MEKIKGLIFDLDGTIGNTLPLCIQAFRQSIEPLALKQLSDQDIIATFGPSEEGTIQTLIPNHYEEGIVNYLQFYEDLHDICPDPFPGITSLLDHLRSKGIRIAMVTGKGEHSTVITLKKFGLDSYFQHIETGSPEGPVKEKGIAAVIRQWPDLDKSSIVYVGDAPSDITASRKAGIPVVAAAWAETAEPEKLLANQPDKIFYSISGFTDWLLPLV
ncbi:HAD family hydrolase [Puia sp. P3]|uniref:HAD family hydrolase n=1 Tax=Puia sp. P3 TaxID=3423952 RepID=UPI003D679E61